LAGSGNTVASAFEAGPKVFVIATGAGGGLDQMPGTTPATKLVPGVGGSGRLTDVFPDSAPVDFGTVIRPVDFGAGARLVPVVAGAGLMPLGATGLGGWLGGAAGFADGFT